MIDDKFVKEIERMADPLVTTVEGKTFSSEPLHEIMPKEWKIPTLEVKTLTALVDYLTVNREQLELVDLFVHIADHETVMLIKRFEGERKTRTVVLLAKLDQNFNTFPFNGFLDQENFLIKAMSLLEDNSDKNELIRAVETIKDGKFIEQSDNKVTQQLHVKTGVHLVSEEAQPIKSTYSLKPFRTFREADQPESQFILRLRSGEGERPPWIALFEADGGAWRLQAMQNIKVWLQEKLPDFPVLA